VPSTQPVPPFSHDDIRPYFTAEGLDLLGVTAAEPIPAAEAAYARWLEEGRAGSMSYMHRHLTAKYRPEAMLPGCRSILLVGVNYYQERAAAGTAQRGSGPERASASAAAPATTDDAATAGRVARYAWGRDYHKAVGKPLSRIARALGAAFPGHRFRGFTDATPLSERLYGERAGIGFQGRNTLLIHPSLGSWFFIGEVLSTLEVAETHRPAGARGACPTHCRRCIEACPTGALAGPYDFDARLCISYLTIEHDGDIAPAIAGRMGDWVFGCDRCQEACPLNAGARPTTVADFLNPIAGSHIELAELLDLPDDDAVRRRFAGSPLLRAKRRGLVRNACIAAANIGARELLPRVRNLTGDADPVVAAAAVWASTRLSDALGGG
jgi:epoxyqueuosine reductase